MVNKKFEVHKIKREIKWSGKEYTFRRPIKNQYCEPSKEMETLGMLNGLYHEQNEHIAVSMVDTTQVRSKKVPSILCVYEDAALLSIRIGDITEINGKPMVVTGVVNIQEWSLIADISLEVIDYGDQDKL